MGRWCCMNLSQEWVVLAHEVVLLREESIFSILMQTPDCRHAISQKRSNVLNSSLGLFAWGEDFAGMMLETHIMPRVGFFICCLCHWYVLCLVVRLALLGTI